MRLPKIIPVVVAAALLAPAAASGATYWKADGEASTLAAEWAEYSTQNNCAVTSDTVTPPDNRAQRWTAFSAKGAASYAFKVQDGDNCFGERAELGQGLPDDTHSVARRFNEGDDKWISFQTYLDASFPINANTWQLIMQIKHSLTVNVPAEQPELALQVRNGQYRMYPACCSFYPLGTAILSKWARWTWHIKFSKNASTGFVEIFADTDGPGGAAMHTALAKTFMATLTTDTSGASVPSHLRAGIYRDTAISGTTFDYLDGLTVASTRAEAEGSAF